MALKLDTVPESESSAEPLTPVVDPDTKSPAVGSHKSKRLAVATRGASGPMVLARERAAVADKPGKPGKPAAWIATARLVDWRDAVACKLIEF